MTLLHTLLLFYNYFFRLTSNFVFAENLKQYKEENIQHLEKIQEITTLSAVQDKHLQETTTTLKTTVDALNRLKETYVVLQQEHNVTLENETMYEQKFNQEHDSKNKEIQFFYFFQH